MAQLVTTAVIRASDQLTGPLAGIAAKVRAANSGFKASAAAAAGAGRTLGAGLGVGLFSIGAMLDKAQEFNKNQLVKPLSVREIEGIVKSCLRSFSCYNGKSADVMKAEKSKFQNLHQELNGILVNTPKNEEFAGKIEDITSAIQSFFEVKFQKAYSRTIPSSEIGKILRAAGFEKKKVQKDGVRAWLWNFDSMSVKHLEAVVEAMKPQVAPETPQAPAEAPIELNVQSTIQSKEVDCSTSEQARMNDLLIDEMFRQLGVALRNPKIQPAATSFAGHVQYRQQIQQAL